MYKTQIFNNLQTTHRNGISRTDVILYTKHNIAQINLLDYDISGELDQGQVTSFESQKWPLLKNGTDF